LRSIRSGGAQASELHCWTNYSSSGGVSIWTNKAAHWRARHFSENTEKGQDAKPSWCRSRCRLRIGHFRQREHMITSRSRIAATWQGGDPVLRCRTAKSAGRAFGRDVAASRRDRRVRCGAGHCRVLLLIPPASFTPVQCASLAAPVIVAVAHLDVVPRRTVCGDTRPQLCPEPNGIYPRCKALFVNSWHWNCRTGAGTPQNRDG
jgi:hypothetical protein